MTKYPSESKKLYFVKTKGMHKGIISGPAYGEAYVIATNPSQAYNIVRSFLDKEDFGFTHERELVSIELIAEQDKYTDCDHVLHIK